jgi:hypothetical protein
LASIFENTKRNCNKILDSSTKPFFMVESLENNYFGVVQFSKKVENEKTCIFLLKKHSSLETNFLLIFCFVEIF